jgi:hypothetical protein
MCVTNTTVLVSHDVNYIVDLLTSKISLKTMGLSVKCNTLSDMYQYVMQKLWCNNTQISNGCIWQLINWGTITVVFVTHIHF